ncbi:hypothetical protein ND748_31790 [Frankia sp. AiPs1]|uniref:hypothetical protein n=1 Tax=Frankia sp. AiPs1 TaxID=573493 RepID=UPI002043D8A4|nr:hypothetical protein [Frankia sp. AiPs1]MCM3926239.1 hypothetical protein [Frankia sp. AiPs1]
MDTATSGEQIWIFGFMAVNLVAGTVVPAAIRRRFSDTAARTFRLRAATANGSAFTVWMAVFWGFTYAAIGAGLLLVLFLVERRPRQRARSGMAKTTGTPPETLS